MDEKINIKNMTFEEIENAFNILMAECDDWKMRWYDATETIDSLRSLLRTSGKGA